MRWVSKRSRASTNVAPQNKTRIQFCVIKIQRRRNNEHNKVLVHFYVIIIIICCSFLRMFAVSVWIYLFLFTSKSSNFTSAVTVCGFFSFIAFLPSLFLYSHIYISIYCQIGFLLLFRTVTHVITVLLHPAKCYHF